MKSWAFFLSQIVIVIGLAGAVFWAIEPQIYIIVGVLSVVVSAGLMTAAEPHLEKTASYLLTTALISILFGLVWPSLPIVVAWGGVVRRAAERKAAADSKDSPSDSGGT